jgi:Skp family chaperone for outer membrane proteins
MALKIFRPFILAMMVACVTVGTGHAQELSKTEKKAIKKEIKGLNRNLESFRKMLLQEGELDKKQKELRDQKIIVQKLHDEIKALNKKQKEVNATPQRTTANVSDTTFKVIIGSYTTKNFSEFANKHKNFVIAPYENPNDNKTYYRYCLGYFTSYWEALYFQKYLAKIMNREGEKYQPYVVGYANEKIIIDVRDLLNKLGL